MTPKSWSLFFSVLLATTFIHDLRVKASDSASSFVSHVVKRDVNLIGTCKWVCTDEPLPPTIPPNPSTNSTGLIVIVNVNANIYSLSNRTANATFVVDVINGLVAVLNGTTGAAVIININTNNGTYLPSGAFLAANVSISTFIASLTNGLKPLLNVTGAVSFQVSTASLQVLQTVNQVLVSLVTYLSLELQINSTVGIKILIAFGRGFSDLFNGPLNGYLALYAANGTIISRDLFGAFSVLQGYASVFVQIPGGLNAVIKAGVNFNADVVSKVGIGLNKITYIISTIGAKIDVGAALGGILNNPQSLFKLIGDLGGSGFIDIDGLFTVLSTIVAYVSRNATLEVTINVIIRFLALNQNNQRTSQNISDTINGSLSDILVAVNSVGANASLSGLVQIDKALSNGSLIINEVNISAILTHLIAGITGTNPLLALISILLLLSPVVAPSICIPTALLVLIINLNSHFGVLLVSALGIVININLGVGGLVGGILGAILGSVLNLVGLILGGILNALLSLPVVSTIVRALASALIEASNGSLDLRVFLTPTNPVVILIKGLIQLITGLQLGVNQTTITRVDGIIKNCSIISLYVNVGINASVSV